MDDNLKQQHIAPIIDSMPMQSNTAPVQTSYHHKKRLVKTVAIVIAVIALIVVGYFVWKKYHHVDRTPQETLNDLRLSSGPDTKTVEQKGATLDALEKGSQKTSLSDKEQLQLLNSLRQ